MADFEVAYGFALDQNLGWNVEDISCMLILEIQLYWTRLDHQEGKVVASSTVTGDQNDLEQV